MAKGGNDSKSESKGYTDSLLGKLSDLVGKSISHFVAFLFIIFALGAFYGTLIVARWPDYSHYLLIAPLVPALLAYYNRAFAAIIFVGLILLFIIL